MRISIHAPVKGATGLPCSLGLCKHISIHAPVKGATEEEEAEVPPGVFQSTLP